MNLMNQLIQKTHQKNKKRKAEKAIPSPAEGGKNASCENGKTIKLNPLRRRTTNYVKPTGRFARRARRRKPA